MVMVPDCGGLLGVGIRRPPIGRSWFSRMVLGAWSPVFVHQASGPPSDVDGTSPPWRWTQMGISSVFRVSPHDRLINGEHMRFCQVVDELSLDRDTLRRLEGRPWGVPAKPRDFPVTPSFASPP